MLMRGLNVVIPVKDRVDQLINCINSVKDSVMDIPCRVYVVVNNNIQSNKLLARVSELDLGNIQLITKDNGSCTVGGAKNAGLALIQSNSDRYDYTIYVDSDDQLTPSINEQIKWLEDHNLDACVSTYLMHYIGFEDRSDYVFEYTGDPLADLSIGPCISGFLYRTDILLQGRFANCRYAEDTALAVIMLMDKVKNYGYYYTSNPPYQCNITNNKGIMNTSYGSKFKDTLFDISYSLHHVIESGVPLTDKVKLIYGNALAYATGHHNYD